MDPASFSMVMLLLVRPWAPSPSQEAMVEQFVRKHMQCLDCLWDQIWLDSVVVQQQQQPPITVIANPARHQQQTVATPRTQVATVLYDFEARNHEELTVKADEKVRFIQHDGDYVLVSKTTGVPGRGMVPTTYVSFSPREVYSEQWYAEGVSRMEAERLLLSPPNVFGSYLVRPSESSAAPYSLSVRAEDKVTHFRLCRTPTGELYLQKDKKFSTMQELLNFHRINWRLLRTPLLQPYTREVQGPAMTNVRYEPTSPSAPEFEIDEWERPRAEFILMKRLGEGYFGEVWEGLWMEEYTVAIKTMKQADMKKEEFLKEINTLKTLSHPNLIQLCAICTVGEPVYIVTELMSNGDLHSYLTHCDKRVVNKKRLMKFSCDIVQGMAYLETQHIIHRDLAARNVLLGEDLTCKIADFGLARLLKDDIYNPSSNTKIPVKWTAPEAANYHQYSFKSDVWSFGILLYEVFTYGQQPYKGLNNREAIDQICNGYRLPRPEICPGDVYSLMLECWRDIADLRPTFQDLREKLKYIYEHMP